MGWLMGAVTHFYLMFKARSRRKKAAKLGVDSSDLVKRTDLSRDDVEDHPKISMLGSISKRIKSSYERLMSPPDDGLEVYDTAKRNEPGFAAGGGSFTQHGQVGSNHPDYGENVYADDGGSAVSVDQQWKYAF
jgi:hypothetical protein